jgi:hypothetical protein
VAVPPKTDPNAPILRGGPQESAIFSGAGTSALDDSATVESRQAKRPPGKAAQVADYPRPRSLPPKYGLLFGIRGTVDPPAFALLYADHSIPPSVTNSYFNRDGGVGVTVIYEDTTGKYEKTLFPDELQLPPELGNGFCKPYHDADAPAGTSGLLRTFPPGVMISITGNLDCQSMINILHGIID